MRRLWLPFVLLLISCTGNWPPIPNPTPPVPTPTPTPTPTPQPIPDPQCTVTGGQHSCWHWPPDSTMPLYACPVYNVEGGVVGVINVTGGPAQCPAKPTPTCPETCPPYSAKRKALIGGGIA